MNKHFTPTTAERLEKQNKRKQENEKSSNTERSKFETHSRRKVRFGALLSITTPKPYHKTKSFMVYLNKPLPWGVIVRTVTEALEELL